MEIDEDTTFIAMFKADEKKNDGLFAFFLN